MGYKIGLLTDSACDLPVDMLEKFDIEMVSLYVIWGTEELRDRVDITPGEFYRRLVTDEVHPMTSQPTPEDFAHGIRALDDRGAEHVLAITISSGMSSTYNSAQQGAESITDVPVTVLDSKANSMSQGWQVLAAARAREVGGGLEDMMGAAEAVRRTLATELYVDTLEYLHKGGRIGAARRWMGSALNLKPQLHVNHQTGEVESGGATRTRRKAIDKMVGSFFDAMPGDGDLHVAVMHGNVPDDVQALAARINEQYHPAELITAMTSPVLGVHTGPGALALCGYVE